MINIRMQRKEVKQLSPKITVVGVGGAGGNAVNNMISSGLGGVEFVVCNTDAQALDGSLCENKIQLGVTVTGGLGAGARPEVGRAAAEESLEEFIHYIDGANMVFITAGMGGGTGTGAAPVIARACRERGILTVGVVTKPFTFEGTLRMKMAEEGIRNMQEYVDTLIVIPNQNLFRIANEKTTFAEAFKMADSVLQAGVRGVTDLIVNPALINLDFADIRTAMMEMGKAMMGMGEAVGDRRAIEAAESAINNPLLDDVSMKGARGVIINVTGGGDMTLFEVDEACNRIREEIDPNANIIFGASFDETMEGVMRVSIVATGIDVESGRKAMGSSGAGLNNTMLNALTSAQQQERKLERTRPQTAADMAPAQTPMTSRPGVSSGVSSASMNRPVSNGIPGMVSAPSRVGSAASGMAARKYEVEAEAEAYEQGEFVTEAAPQPEAQAQTMSSAQRGVRYQDSFIPPAPMEASVPRTPEPVYAQHAMPVQAQMVQQQPVPQAPVQQQPMQQQPAQQGYNLRPPVMNPAVQKKRAPSLFERFTQGLRQDDDMGEVETGSDTASSAGSSSGGLRAPSKQSSYHAQQQSSYQQGRLNIDSPAAPVASRPGPQVEDELDIPAFLRRQAN
jgi:cell division protein FtsZ